LKFSSHDMIQLSRQFVEGVAYLHQHGVAHMDIKPDNILCDYDHRNIWIIDFDNALRCSDVNEQVTTARGTPRWAAPEVDLSDSESGMHSQNTKQSRTFNPIRADLYSAGKVLKFFATDKIGGAEGGIDQDMLLLADLLMDEEPTRRPLLQSLINEDESAWTFQDVIVKTGKTANGGRIALKRGQADSDIERLDEEVLARRVHRRIQDPKPISSPTAPSQLPSGPSSNS